MRVTLSPDTVRGLAALTDAAVEGDKDAQAELVADLAVMLGCECAEGYESEDDAHDAILRGLWAQAATRRVQSDLQRACGAIQEAAIDGERAS